MSNAYISPCLSLYLSLSSRTWHLFIHLSLFVYLSTCIYLSIDCRFIYLSMYLSIYLSLSLSLSRSLCLSLCLSLYLCRDWLWATYTLDKPSAQTHGSLAIALCVHARIEAMIEIFCNEVQRSLALEHFYFYKHSILT